MTNAFVTIFHEPFAQRTPFTEKYCFLCSPSRKEKKCILLNVNNYCVTYCFIAKWRLLVPDC